MVKAFHLHISGMGMDLAESALPGGEWCRVERMVNRKKMRPLEWGFSRRDWPQICCFRY